MPHSLILTLAYLLFAVIATIFNILTQDILIHLYTGQFSLYISVLFGTAIGLIIKYVLDKRYIFKYQTKNLKHNSQIFALYIFMGLITTAIFWSFEFGFNYAFENKEMRYVGAVIGLMIGYICKYFLDKRFVFSKV